MAITISELEYFLATAELQSITKAAETLHLSQPSLSRSISSLEGDLGVQLFDRVGRSIILNHNGEVVQKYAERIITQLKAMENELADVTSQNERLVSITISAASTILPLLISEFNRTSPDTLFDVRQHVSANGHNDFATDLNLFSTFTPINNNHTVTLLKEDMLLAIPDSYPQAKYKAVNLSAFAGNGFITLQKGKDLRTITDHYCNEAGFIPKIFLESDSPFTVREFIKAGIGVAFVPEITWHSVCGPNIALMPIRMPHCTRYIHLSWNPSGYLSKQAYRFRNYVMNHFEEFAKKDSGVI